MESLNLPTQQECLAFFEQYVVPPNIQDHCMAVQRYGLFLAQELAKAGVEINIGLLGPLLLLHDVFKIAAIEDIAPNKDHPNPFTREELAMRTVLREKYPGLYEGEIAYEVWKDTYPELALSLKKASDPKSKKSSEEMFAHYVDWCVLKMDYVGLDKRIAYLRRRYANEKHFYEDEFKEVREFEADIFSKLPFTPQQIPKLSEKFYIGPDGLGRIQGTRV